LPRRRLTDLAWRLRHPSWARDRTQSLDPTATPPPPVPQSDPTQPLYRYFLDRRSGLSMHKWHHYFDIYERHFAPFRGRGISMIEIGVHRGGSLRMWRDYFGPGCRIADIDIDPACAAVADEDISIFIGDQADPKFLREVLAQTGPPTSCWTTADTICASRSPRSKRSIRPCAHPASTWWKMR
jgi:hypothetical protein